jgi:tagatose 6-phosphate kinase
MILTLGTTPAVQRVMRFGQLTVDAVNRASSVTEAAAGKAINVAKVAAALGQPVLTLGLLGGDRGKTIIANLQQLGVRHEFVAVDPPTRMCVTLVDESAGTTTELVEESSPVEAGDYQKLLELLSAKLQGARVLVLSGTLTPGGPAEFYRDCVARASAAGVASIVDAKGEPLLAALSARPTVVKPNLAELSQTLGKPLIRDADIRDAARRLVTGGAGWALVTRGPRPAILCDGESFWTVHIPAVKAVNPIGSGDAVAAGLAASLSRGVAMPEACRLGIACGAANAMTALAGEVHQSDVQALLPQVRIERT